MERTQPDKQARRLALNHRSLQEEEDGSDEEGWEEKEGLEDDSNEKDFEEQQEGESEEEEGDQNDENEDESDEDEEEEDVEEIDNKIKKLKSELAEIPFGMLLEMQKSGETTNKQARKTAVLSKIYNKTLGGDENGKKQREKGKSNEKSKDGPQVMSTKYPVSRFRQVIGSVPSKPRRDPRFDNLSGKFEPKTFRQDYKFLDDLRENEISILKKELKKTDNSSRRLQLRRSLNSLENHQQKSKREDEKQQLVKKWIGEQKQRVSEGKKPQFIPKKELRQIEMVEKYKKLQKTNRVDAYISKKRKRTEKKTRSHLPFSRRDIEQ